MTDPVLTVCPPYPESHSSVRGLFEYLTQLQQWVLLHRDNHNKLIGAVIIPVVKPLPAFHHYQGQSIQTQFGHLCVLRRLRESWDHLVRSYATDWDGAACLQQRVLIVQAAAVLLNDCHLPAEQREFKQRGLAELQSVFYAGCTSYRRTVRGTPWDAPVN